MRKLNRLTLTLALLLTAVTGAWAEDTFTITFSANGNTKTVENITLPHTFGCNFNGDLGRGTGELDVIIQELYGLSGGTCASVFPESDNASVTCDVDNKDNQYIIVNAPFNGTATVTGSYFDASFDLFNYSLEISIAEPTEWSLTPDETGKKWTLAKMPASNVDLQVEYFAESNLFLSKDALADKANIAVTAGETTVEFGEDGKSANTITEGTPMTVKYNGSREVKSVTVVKVAKGGAVDNAYMKWDADQKKLVATPMPESFTTVTSEVTEWSAGTYVVEGEVDITSTIELSGDVNLIIKDGAKLTVPHLYGNSHNLSIYGQAQMTGELDVYNSYGDAINEIPTLEVHSAKVTATSSESYGAGFGDIGTFNVYGGSVDAKGTAAEGGCGICLSENGSMNIYGGEVKAEGKGIDLDSYGITCAESLATTVKVYGGKLWAGCADNVALDRRGIHLTKDNGYTSGKIETSDDNVSWNELLPGLALTTKYVRVGY